MSERRYRTGRRELHGLIYDSGSAVEGGTEYVREAVKFSKK